MSTAVHLTVDHPTIVHGALEDFRRVANWERLNRAAANHLAFCHGLALGQVIAVAHDADPLLVAAAENEIQFLAYNYQERAHV